MKISNTLMHLLANFIFFVSFFLFYAMPVWIFVSSFFTFMAALFLVPFYMPLWIILQGCCRLLLRSSLLKEHHVQRLERAITLNKRALKYNFYLSLPILLLLLGHLHKLGKI